MSLSFFKRSIRKKVDAAFRGLSRIGSWSFRMNWEYGTLYGDREVQNPDSWLQAFALSARTFSRSNNLRLTVEYSNVRNESVVSLNAGLPFLISARLRIDLGGLATLRIQRITGKGASKLYGAIFDTKGGYLYTGYDIDRPEATSDDFDYFKWKNICGKPKYEVSVLKFVEISLDFPGSHQIESQTCDFKYVVFRNVTKWGWFPYWFKGETRAELVTDNPPKICSSDGPVLNRPQGIYYRLFSGDTTFEEAVRDYGTEIFRLRQVHWDKKHN